MYEHGTSQKAGVKRKGGKPNIVKHKIQKKSTVQAGTKVIPTKKAVNGYIIFRSAMSALFPTYTQSQRSTFVRIMWEKEQHKTSYSLMGKAWTYVRDNTNYRDLATFIVGAQQICGVVPPEKFFQTYRLTFITHPNNSVELAQTAVPARGSISPARDLSDFQLLTEMLENGLPVESPVQLEKMMGEQDHFMHIMTMGQTPVETTFAAQVDFNCVETCAELLHLEPSHNVFDTGVNVVDCEDLTSFDTSNILADGQVYRRFKWDTAETYMPQPDNTVLDLTHVEDQVKMYTYDQPGMFESAIGYTSEHAFKVSAPEAGDNTLDMLPDDFHLDDFFMATAFEEEFPDFDFDGDDFN